MFNFIVISYELCSLIISIRFLLSSRGVWDPERWHSDRKRSDTPPKDERTGRGDQVTENHNKRRNGDPRERIRKEQDGIVLSPQRRSFNSGCFVNVNQPSNRRPESPIGKTEVVVIYLKNNYYREILKLLEL